MLQHTHTAENIQKWRAQEEKKKSIEYSNRTVVFGQRLPFHFLQSPRANLLSCVFSIQRLKGSGSRNANRNYWQSLQLVIQLGKIQSVIPTLQENLQSKASPVLSFKILDFGIQNFFFCFDIFPFCVRFYPPKEKHICDHHVNQK
uniref:Uncharacterized protein n=1 Tax=Pyxicephalus adspersus TaxID=30357 RepID=A0AAV2ZYS3_PYXAD|nr:TPA: hypothetical protein GDO54_015417 [Pyxicephalus adspersus]